jgi:cephalosporin-C deacetylase
LLFINSPGFSLSAGPWAPGESARHVLHGIASRDTYVLRACVAALWSSISALHGLFPGAAARTFLDGDSFGGGLAALAMPWDRRICRGALVIPTFGHHPLRLRFVCTGSGESVRKYHQEHPEIAQTTLPYYDAAIAASLTTIPVLSAPALFDPAVAPPGQFAIANALAGPTRTAIFSAHHCEHSNGDAEESALAEEIFRWYSV